MRGLGLFLLLVSIGIMLVNINIGIVIFGAAMILFGIHNLRVKNKGMSYIYFVGGLVFIAGTIIESI
ncbi:hypothetical protein [Halobacillus naozhouensis]|uniref:DUF3953 domain-containing protein n=1 Tax=Halobacillus naozhouensis TaxID=554880 RepID=A0ABY8IY86_9BACI|nr:hypothetical protein [Halobacillus naozhouensis]WFT74168.1 hypothetical protein P9989_17655 [Halobacillus naozhouensis]